MPLWHRRGDGRVLETRLDDGQAIIARPLIPDDARALLNGWRALSDRSRLFRFLRDTPPPTLDQARGLSEGDTGRDVALGAALLVGGTQVPACVARFYGIDERVAEMAVTVVDHTQSRGLGTLMLGLLADVACARGFTRFVGLVHVRNGAMLHLLDELGATLGSRQQMTREFILPLDPNPENYPQTHAGDVFRRAHALRRAFD